MSAESIVTPDINEREEYRLPYQGAFEYTCESDSGVARWSSVSHQGACITMGRYLSPGRLIRISQENHALIGSVVWCKPTRTPNTFVAGIRFMDNGVEASFMVLSTMVHHMLTTRQQQAFKQPNQQPLAAQ